MFWKEQIARFNKPHDSPIKHVGDMVLECLITSGLPFGCYWEREDHVIMKWSIVSNKLKKYVSYIHFIYAWLTFRYIGIEWLLIGWTPIGLCDCILNILVCATWVYILNFATIICPRKAVKLSHAHLSRLYQINTYNWLWQTSPYKFLSSHSPLWIYMEVLSY